MELIWQQQAADDVRTLLLEARHADGPLPGEFRGGRHLHARDNGALVGYAHPDTRGGAFGNQTVKPFGHPAPRRRDIGSP